MGTTQSQHAQVCSLIGVQMSNQAYNTIWWLLVFVIGILVVLKLWMCRKYAQLRQRQEFYNLAQHQNGLRALTSPARCKQIEVELDRV